MSSKGLKKESTSFTSFPNSFFLPYCLRKYKCKIDLLNVIEH